MDSPVTITKAQVALAFTTAIVVDILQLPANLVFFAGALSGAGLIAVDVPIETIDTLVDIAAGCVISSLIGFHWTLLPTFALEVVPAVDALPTWTACVAYVVAKRKREGKIAGSAHQTLDVVAVNPK